MRLDGRDPAAVEQAAEQLAAGELVAFPTETVYGLGARADDDAATAKIFARKGRPTGHPLIVHVPDAAGAGAFAAHLSPVAERLIDAFWPGPLTVIVARAPDRGAAAAGGQSTIGLRCPAHPVAHALLDAARRRGVLGVAAPSANRFGRVSPTTAAHVLDEFGDDLLVLDGGACRIGIESSIVDCSGAEPVLLRPGMLARERIEAAAGVALGEPTAASPRASGTLEAHYAPDAKVRLMPTAMLKTALQVIGPEALKLAVYSRSIPSGVAPGLVHRRMPARPEQAAHELFGVLREFDRAGIPLIWVEEPPPGPEWDGVRDRLRRAAAA
ncbi:L-threonylcarbamoyladenylate synthase [Piscinibacter koreensis]|uniref:Threonylcarbamoyl-AMP synthase n=1 Tax=Piscinibacter koreensis TaxID=2742824 RepID=A0A7Y6TWW7_9BURK|nr:L-threonylcarbamoyladenylate synthase [Schlegelella koreensis]NUZ06452.1 threonylcarbamoyl-AMP synthase [Schlegelella koreensis]